MNKGSSCISETLKQMKLCQTAQPDSKHGRVQYIYFTTTTARLLMLKHLLPSRANILADLSLHPIQYRYSVSNGQS